MSSLDQVSVISKDSIPPCHVAIENVSYPDWIDDIIIIQVVGARRRELFIYLQILKKLTVNHFLLECQHV